MYRMRCPCHANRDLLPLSQVFPTYVRNLMRESCIVLKVVCPCSDNRVVGEAGVQAAGMVGTGRFQRCSICSKALAATCWPLVCPRLSWSKSLRR